MRFTKKDKYLLKEPYYNNARRIFVGGIILDVDTLKLCTTLYGNGIYYFDFKEFLKYLGIKEDIFKVNLEKYLQGSIYSLSKVINQSIKDSSSILHKCLVKSNSKFLEISSLETYLKSYLARENLHIKDYNTNFSFLYSMCRLKGENAMLYLDIFLTNPNIKVLSSLITYLNMNDFTSFRKTNKEKLLKEIQEYTSNRRGFPDKLSNQQANYILFDTLAIINNI